MTVSHFWHCKSTFFLNVTTVAHFDTLENLPIYPAFAGLDMGARAGAYRPVCSLAACAVACVPPCTLRVRTETLFLNMHVRNSTVTTSDVHLI